MKRLLAIFCALAMVTLLFAGCGGGGEATEAVKIMNPADFEGRVIAVQYDTTADYAVTDLIDAGANFEVRRYDKVTQCFDDLKLGRVDAVYVDSVVAAFYTKDDDAFERTWLDDVPEPLGICLAKGSDSLAAAVEAALDTLNFTGKMNEIAMAHFGDDFTANLRDVAELPEIPDEFETKKEGVLMVGCEPGYPPMEYTTEDGLSFIGFDIDVGKAIAEVLGLEWELVPTAWDGIFEDLDRGSYDLIISSVSITPARAERFILTEPYVANALCIVAAA